MMLLINCNIRNSFVNTTSLIIISINITIRMIVNRWQNMPGKSREAPKQENNKSRKGRKAEKLERH